jgi:hypothetical protein
MDTHATIEELLEVMFSVVRVETAAIKRCGKHSSTTIGELFSMSAVQKGFQWDQFIA